MTLLIVSAAVFAITTATARIGGDSRELHHLDESLRIVTVVRANVANAVHFDSLERNLDLDIGDATDVALDTSTAALANLDELLASAVGPDLPATHTFRSLAAPIDASGTILVNGALGSATGTEITFSVLATDPDGLSAGASITISVRNVTVTNTTIAPSTTVAPTQTTTLENRPPIARDDLVVGNEDTGLQFDPLRNDVDPDGDPLELTWLTVPAQGEIRGGYLFLPRADWNGTTKATYRIDDGRGGSAFGTVTFVVNPVNDAPRIQPSSDLSKVSSGGSIQIPIPRIVDPESDGYTITIGDPRHGTAEIVGSSIVYAPDPGYEARTPSSSSSWTPPAQAPRASSSSRS